MVFLFVCVLLCALLIPMNTSAISSGAASSFPTLLGKNFGLRGCKWSI